VHAGSPDRGVQRRAVAEKSAPAMVKALRFVMAPTMRQ